MGSKRRRIVIQTDESLSLKPSWADSEAWAVLNSPDQLWALRRGCEHSLCTDLVMQSHLPETSQLAVWLTPKSAPPAITEPRSMCYLDTKHHKYQRPLLVCGCVGVVGCGSRGKLLAFGRANMPLAVPQPHTILVPRDVPYTSVSVPASQWQRGDSGWSRGFLGAGGDVVRLTAHSAVQRKWDDTVLPIQQHSPSHKPWHWLPAH